MDEKEKLNNIRDISILGMMGERPDRTILIRCPFPGHNDRTPSCWIKPNNFYNCFGCGKRGKNFIDFCMDLGEDMQSILKEYS